MSPQHRKAFRWCEGRGTAGAHYATRAGHTSSGRVAAASITRLEAAAEVVLNQKPRKAAEAAAEVALDNPLRKVAAEVAAVATGIRATLS